MNSGCKKFFFTMNHGWVDSCILWCRETQPNTCKMWIQEKIEIDQILRPTFPTSFSVIACRKFLNLLLSITFTSLICSPATRFPPSGMQEPHSFICDSIGGCKMSRILFTEFRKIPNCKQRTERYFLIRGMVKAKHKHATRSERSFTSFETE